MFMTGVLCTVYGAQVYFNEVCHLSTSHVSKVLKNDVLTQYSPLFTLATRRIRPWQRDTAFAHAQTLSKAILSNNPYGI